MKGSVISKMCLSVDRFYDFLILQHPLAASYLQFVTFSLKKERRHHLVNSVQMTDHIDIISLLASLADLFRGSSRVPAPQTSAQPKDKFLSHCSQISPGDHMQIIGASEVNDKLNTYVQAR